MEKEPYLEIVKDVFVIVFLIVLLFFITVCIELAKLF